MSRRVVERRQAQRYPVQLRVELEGGQGLTRDVSSLGAYFETDRPISPGALLRFTMVMEHARPDAPVRLGCEGEIVRVERQADRVGVAVAFHSHWLTPAGPP